MAEIVAVPVFVELNVTWHVAVPAVAATNVHGLPVNDVPVAIPVWLKATVPPGVTAVPAVVVSVTVAVHVED